MSGVFRRVGRGGAGNFSAAKDVEAADAAATAAAASRAQQDPEAAAQKPTTPAPAAEHAAPSSGPVYARAGRGGAGNFHEPTLGDAMAAEQAAERLRAALGAAPSSRGSLPRTGAGPSGRGGAGNWGDGHRRTAGEGEGDAEERRRKVAELEARVRADVEAGLAMPARAYRHHEREVEK